MKPFLMLIFVCIVVSTHGQTLSKRQLKKMNKATSSIFKGQCPLERIDWMEVSEGFDRNAMIAIATELQASAKADASKIKNIAEGNASAKVKGDFSQTVNKLGEKKTKVSQAFYEQYLMMRTPVCNIYQAVQSGFYYNNSQGLTQAQNVFTEMNTGWLAYIKEEEKKSPR